MFENLETSEDIKEDGDSLGRSFGPIDSALYDMKIKYAYTTKSKGGALAMNLLLVTEGKQEVPDQQWLTGGDAKGNKNFYMVKENGKETGKKAYLPGFNAINNLCLLAAGKELSKLDTEKKTIKLYDFNAKAEVPTEVDMVMDLVGKDITAGVLKAIVDKKKLNEQTSKYEPTGETREVNEVDKYFRHRDGLTVAEIRAGAEESTFKGQWEEKWKGQVKESFDKKAVKNAGTTGSPVSAGADAPKTDMFS